MSLALITFDELQRMGMAIAKSGLFGAKSPEQAIALMLIAQAEGRHPASAAQDYDIIQGKAAKKAEAMLRDFIGAGGMVQWHRLDDGVAEATFSHHSGGSVKIHWDIARAARAGLTNKDNWKKYPRAMLRSRCISEGCKTIYPVSTGGMHTPEETESFEDERDVTPVTPESSAKALKEIQSAKAELIPGFSPPKTPAQLVQDLAQVPNGKEQIASIVKNLVDGGHLEAAGKLEAEMLSKFRLSNE